MHHKMMSALGADATETWVRKTIEHHRGAIAMSKIPLRDSKDQKVRQMAEKTTSEQEREIGDCRPCYATTPRRRSRCPTGGLARIDAPSMSRGYPHRSSSDETEAAHIRRYG